MCNKRLLTYLFTYLLFYLLKIVAYGISCLYTVHEQMSQ